MVVSVLHSVPYIVVWVAFSQTINVCRDLDDDAGDTDYLGS